MNKLNKQFLSFCIILSFFVIVFPVMAADFPDPLNGVSLQILIGRIIYAVLGIIGSLFLVMFIYGGVTWMMSSGSNEKVQKGKDILIWATIGLVVIFASYSIVRFIFAGLKI
ncbi:hypothetical protein A2331_03840 [Candidatus Falkowbacteria bacterium RIFOXYB2_FULL_34_18]|uniref:Uncharacterized protein n=1 Tax=Candidatus Falkowbacteria bacterium RIFOXYD2_FULL_34_120 TaxID=1798007 RepID=A0A1F5TPM0_9BACT|nr:MAG: hypothetical protein A2331_03840 [Candidatus Falkowbacteria bacterium RIFOXYB2_FULL_34_18]OGF29084.1 MAG: hypothetical protein A2500_03165 [Candidatus Falkowbacteria bacterium RIFOXYC12_FULL_34_55]OGF36167.1 MAG: hypothetical protein A2466_04695 [Candidatus Falkowbacteria bacterium RIFOXYC2_FULL_34_220]OGF38594.1 MAG: hypothetical protein A2515_02055 [Candidatus Falkowbacteria bacterium RIFOXYD12_FULL_34_57]OGF40777.1 MAG: hypothetical protein A2531_06700 [Candidatus Falkowbacteria bact